MGLQKTAVWDENQIMDVYDNCPQLVLEKEKLASTSRKICFNLKTQESCLFSLVNNYQYYY